MPLLPLPKPPWISRWRWPPPAMEASPTASRVPHPRDRRDCSRLAEVVGPRRAPPSLLVPHNGYGPSPPLHPALLLLHFKFPVVAEGRFSLSTLPIWSTGGERGSVRRRWRPASARP
uniref:Uncharacterized protein n=1 Tax=Aegilops tauschii subsp. strangulata TaxID=200361 RepID=A0A453FJG3_AEGTS